MKDEDKNKKELIKELEALRKWIVDQEMSEFDRKKVEEALEEEKNKAQKYLDIADVILLVIGLDQNVTLINKKGCAVFGCEQEDIIGKNWFDNFLPKNVIKGEKAFFKKLISGKAGPFEFREYRIVTKSGDEKLIAWHITILKDNEGNITGTLSSGEDITGKKDVEHELESSRRMLQMIYDTIPEAIIVTDSTNKIISCNKAVLSILGYKIEELVGRDYKIIVSERMFTDPNEKERHGELMKTGILEREDFYFKKKNGDEFPSSFLVALLRDDNNNIKGMVGTIRDITDRLQADEKIKNARDRAGLYLDILGHDISNINQGIRTSIELLSLKEDISEENKKYIDICLNQSRAMSNLIKNVQKLSNIEDRDFQEKIIDLSEIIESSIQRMNMMFPDSNIQINHSFPDDCLHIIGNDLMQDVVDNILMNAIKFNNKPDVKINIYHSIIEQNKYLKLEFKDNGPGIADDMKSSVFKRLERGNDNVHGTGLGLSIVNEIVNRSGGRAMVEDRIKGDSSQGSNFIIILPRGD